MRQSLFLHLIYAHTHDDRVRISATDLALFLEVYRAGTLSGAAVALKVNQSTISRRLTEIEDRLGAALFVRHREGIQLTPLGAKWVGPANAIDGHVQDVVRTTADQLDDRHNVEVTVATVNSIADHLLVPALPRFFARHPHTRLNIVASPLTTDLSRLEADIAVRVMRPTAGDLIVQRVTLESVVPVARPDLAAKLSDLPPVSWPWIALGREKFLPRPIALWQASHGVVPRVTVDSGSTQIIAIRSGVGVGWLADRLRAHLGLTAMPTAGLPKVDGALWLATHQALRPLAYIDAVWRWIEATMRAPVGQTAQSVGAPRAP